MPPDEEERLRVVRELEILDTDADPVFDAIARLACVHTGCPIGAISVVDSTRQWFLASVGLAARQTPRDQAFCAHSICSGDGLTVADATRDPRFRHNDLVVGAPHVVFYASIPLLVGGQPVGTVLVIDHQPRAWEEAQRAALVDLATVVSAMLDARLRERRWKRQEGRVVAASQAGADWLWETDPEGVLTWVSDSVVDHTGWSAAHEIGKQATTLNRPPPGDLRPSWDRYREARRWREPFHEAIAERDSAHGTILVAMSGRPRFDEQGVFLGYCGAARDVTRETAERERLLSEQRLLFSAIDSVNAGVMVSGPDGRIRISNSSWRRNIGAFCETDEPTWEDLVRSMVRRGQYPEAIGREEEFVRWRLSLASPKGTAHELRFGDQIALITDQQLPDGNVVHLSIDVSESRRAERELQAQRERAGASEAFLAAVLQAIPDLWFVLDAEGRYEECSDENHPWLPAPFSDMRGRSVGSYQASGLAERLLPALATAHSTGMVQSFAYQLSVPGATPRHFEARVSPMPGGRSLCLTRDLTELRLLAREVGLLQRALEADGAMPLAILDIRERREQFSFVNHAFEQLTGFPRAELLGRNARLLLSDDAQAATLHTLRGALREGNACTTTLRLKRRDGRHFLSEIQLAPVRGDDGHLSSVIGVVSDITERMAAATKLSRSEELYRAVAQGISDGLLVVGADGLILTCNPAACTALGVSMEQLVGTRLSRLGFELQHMNDGRRVSRQEHPVTRVMSGAGVIEDLYRLRRPDGQMMQVRMNVRTLFERSGSEPATCLVAFRDVTAQRAAEEALKRAEERWQFAIDGAREGVWDYAEDTQTMFFSRRWKEMIGYEEAEIGSDIGEWIRRIHPDDKPRVMQAVIDYRRGVTTVYETEHRLRHKLGHWIWVLDRGKIVERAPDGRPRRVVGTQTDITQMKLAEQTLRDQHALALASRAKTEFLSRMSHEMRTPLNAVIGFTQLLLLQRHTLTPSKVQEFAGHVMDASQHLLGLVNDVLDLQRVEDGSISLELGAVGLKDLVESTLTLLQPLAQQVQVALEATLPVGAVVRADRRRLQQVLINLLSNAIKYNRPDGWVRVTVEDASAGRLRIAIEDGGRGMSAEQLSRLFQPFERLGRETTSVQGSGLGLVIARRIAEEMGCTLTLDSVEGHGTIARIDLPAASAQEVDAKTAVPGDDDPPTAVATGTAAGGAPIRVLYVEDNPVNVIVFEETIRLCPQAELRVATTGADALTLVGDWLPDVLVLDANLPDMSGFELLERLRSVAVLHQAPAYMCSAAAMPEDLQRAREAGFKDYWVKPIDIAQVVSALNALALSLSAPAPPR